MIEIYERKIKHRTMRKLEKLRSGSWVCVEDPSQADLEVLVKELSLDLSLLRDGLDPHEVPRFEVKDKVVYVFVRVPYESGHEVMTSPLLFVMHSDYLVVVSRCSFSFFEAFRRGGGEIYTTQKTKLFLQMLQAIHGVYRTFLTRFHREVRSARVELEQIRNQDIARFVRLENTLNDFVSSLIPTKSVLDTLLSGKLLRLYEKDRDLVEDISLTTNELVQSSKSNLKTIVNIRDAYSTIMTNNLNRVIKFFTAVTVLLTIPTMIASLYGMNVRLPFSDSPDAFLGILVLTLGITFVLLVIFIRNRWL